MAASEPDIAILGGGLAGGLVALAMARWRPQARVLLIDEGQRFGGNHVWSFFATDLDADGRELVAPLVEAAWDGYEVRFPQIRRVLTTPYRATTSERLDAALRATLPTSALMTGTRVVACTAHSVDLADGRRLRAGAVLDARGIERYAGLTGGWQKFVGHRLKLAAPHGLSRPVVMDATVTQRDGFRFVYCLPFARDEVFVEDTYYADTPDLDPAQLGERIAAYAQAQGWTVIGVIAQEHGVLPVVAGGQRPLPSAQGAATAGSRAGLFHPLTSYSLPDAVGFAVALAKGSAHDAAEIKVFSEEYSRKHWQKGHFYRALSAMLFAAAEPLQRWKVLQRFYRLDQQLIERFYAGRNTWADCARILAGRPPVPVWRAAGVLSGLGRRPAPLDAQEGLRQ